MKEHKATFPIIVNVLEGVIDFWIQGIYNHLKAGFIVTLEGNDLYNLTASEASVVRLTLFKIDNPKPLEEIAKK